MGKPKTGRSAVFRFKQFNVDQTDCAMKINTDGVLLGAMACPAPDESPHPGKLRILDIGTGTGVIALMLAQRFPEARIEAIEIDQPAAERATENFRSSPFASRLHARHVSLEYFTPGIASSPNDDFDGYDLIVSNPPFFLDSLKNPDKRKELARHADRDFFERLLARAARWLRPQGTLQLILPTDLSERLERQAIESYGFHSATKTAIHSFPDDDKPIRMLLSLTKSPSQHRPVLPDRFVIYAQRGQYSAAYRHLLKDFFLDF